MTVVWRICLLALLCAAALAAPSRPALAADFADVPKWHWAWRYVQGVSDAGVAGGYADGYHPEYAVSRDQMAVFIARGLAGGDQSVPSGPATATFPDVPTGYWAYRHVEYAVDQNVVSGYGDGLYHPDWAVTRGQMAVFVARALVAPAGEAGVPGPAGAPTFPDVSADTDYAWCWPHVEHIAAEGVTQGYGDGLYHPEYVCSRDQMAVYICRAWDLPMPPQPHNITDYWPLLEGNTWSFKTDRGPYTDAVSGAETIDGEEYVCLRFPDDSVNYWQVADDGLRHGGWDDPDYGRVTYESPIYLPNGLDPGDALSGSTTAYLDGAEHGDITWAMEFLGTEGITVPAGAFADCAKLEFHIVGPDDELHVVQWLAKGVGPVKRDARPFAHQEWEELVSATISGVRYPAQGWDVTDYWPLGEGDAWNYASQDGPRTETVLGTEELEGEVYSRVVHSDSFIQYFQAAADGLRAGGWYHPDDGLATYEPPAYVPHGLYPNDADTQSLRLYLNGADQGEAVYEYEFIGLEDVTVPAGTFENCLKLRVGIELPLPEGDAHTDFYLWLAEGVGKVKSDERPFGGADWDELVSANVGGVRYPAQGWDITDYWPLGEGDTWTWQTNGGTHSQTISGTQEIDGRLYARVVYPSGKVHYYQNAADGMRHAGWDDPVDGEIRYDPPRYLPNGLYPGDPITLTNDVYDDGILAGQVTLTGTFLGLEDATVPAGFFPNCMKLEVHGPDYPGEAADHTHMWLAAGVGEVKSDEAPFGGDGWSQLLSATIGGIPYP